MAKKTVTNVTVKRPVEEKIRADRILQLSTLRLYHQKKIEGIDQYLRELLKEEIENVDY